MRNALSSLPGVEKASIKVNVETQRASFSVTDPKQFKAEDAVNKVNNDTDFKASVLSAGGKAPAQ